MRLLPSPAENNTTSPGPCLWHDFPRALTENLHPPHPFLERCSLLPPRGQRDKPTRNEIHLLQVHPPSSIVSSNSRLTTGISFQVTNSTTLMHESHFGAPSFPVFKTLPPSPLYSPSSKSPTANLFHEVLSSLFLSPVSLSLSPPLPRILLWRSLAVAKMVGVFVLVFERAKAAGPTALVYRHRGTILNILRFSVREIARSCPPQLHKYCYRDCIYLFRLQSHVVRDACREQSKI